MKTAIFNFLVLQAIVWALVFSSDYSSDNQKVQYASLTDTWEVIKVGDSSNPQFVLHYPTFNKLTLNSDGTYIRLKDDKTLEEGRWELNDGRTRLTLYYNGLVKKFEILKMPNSDSETFVIKEYLDFPNSESDLKYELERM